MKKEFLMFLFASLITPIIRVFIICIETSIELRSRLRRLSRILRDEFRNGLSYLDTVRGREALSRVIPMLAAFSSQLRSLFESIQELLGHVNAGLTNQNPLLDSRIDAYQVYRSIHPYYIQDSRASTVDAMLQAMFQEVTRNNFFVIVPDLNRGIISNEVLESVSASGGGLGLQMLVLLGFGIFLISEIVMQFSGIPSEFGILYSVFELLGNLSSTNDLVRNDFRVLLTIVSELPS